MKNTIFCAAFIVAVFLSIPSRLHAQYNGDCVDAGPECTSNSGTGGSNGQPGNGIGVDPLTTIIADTFEGSTASDSCSGANAPVECASVFQEGGQLSPDVSVDLFLAGGAAWAANVLSDPENIVIFDQVTTNQVALQSQRELMAAINDFNVENVSVLGNELAEEVQYNTMKAVLDMNGMDVSVKTAIQEGGQAMAEDLAATIVRGAGVATMVLMPSQMGNDSMRSNSMNYSSIGSHMLQESGTVPSSIYGNNMATAATKSPTCMFQQGGC